MKRIVFYIATFMLATILLFGCGTVSKETTDSDSFGPLKKMIYKDGNGNIQEIVTYSYNDQGLVSTINYTDGAGNVTSYRVYSYDSAGNEAIEIKYDADNSIVYIYESEYNASGNLMKEEKRNSQNELNECHEYFYDSNGNKTKVVHCNYEYNSFYNVEYDAQGRDVRRTRFDNYGKVTSDNIYTYEGEYDENNVLIKTYKKKQGNVTVATTSYTYDSAGNLIITDYNSSESGIRDLSEYSSGGNLIKVTTYYLSGDTQDIWIFYYDENQDFIKWEVIEMDGTVNFYAEITYYEPGVKASWISKDKNDLITQSIEYEYY